ncbi:MAG: Fic family protein [Coriobacteriales bacterium]|jgi:Fic family protein|nr:Fic family protein [Coriobacteriales bacterium]
MTDIKDMTREKNIAYAKRMLVDIIWKQANIEGINVTFPDTQTIIDNGVISDLLPSDVIAIVNLKRAWYKLLDSVDEPLSLDYIKAIHAEIGHNLVIDSGKLRNGNVGIAGCKTYQPPVPDEAQTKLTLAKLMGINNPESRAFELYLWLTKSQLFWDGNKRIAHLIANKVLIENSRGIINISQEYLAEFNLLLHNYYEYDARDPLLSFLQGKAIDGILTTSSSVLSLDDKAKEVRAAAKDRAERTNPNNPKDDIKRAKAVVSAQSTRQSKHVQKTKKVR